MSTRQPINRRAFVQQGGSALTAAATAASAPAFLQGQDQNRPNIIVVTVDQMRGDALSLYGNPNAKTPTLDRMCREGVSFDNGFCNNPLCVPSRISLYKGLDPGQHGQLHNRHGKIDDMDLSITAMVKEAGYRTGFFGKNHMFFDESMRKYFDVLSIRDRENFRAYSPLVPAWWHGDAYWPEEECHPNKNVRELLDFAAKSKPGQPFYAGLSIFDPHPPYMAPSEYAHEFDPDEMVVPPFVPAAALGVRLDEYRRAMGYQYMNETDLKETLRYYYAQVLWCDAMMGRVIDGLDRLGVLENTVIFFTSDHGDFMGEHWMTRKGMFHHDALLHVPFIWYAPGRFATGHRVTEAAQLTDVFPTLADMLGMQVPTACRGKSLTPHLQAQAESDPDRPVYAMGAFHEVDRYLLDEGPVPAKKLESPRHTRTMKGPKPEDFHRFTASARTAEWRYITSSVHGEELYRYEKGSWQETKNLAGNPNYADVQRRLAGQLAQQWQLPG
jgi:arylsulfatase A-like enzyme